LQAKSIIFLNIFISQVIFFGRNLIKIIGKIEKFEKISKIFAAGRISTVEDSIKLFYSNQL